MNRSLALGLIIVIIIVLAGAAYSLTSGSGGATPTTTTTITTTTVTFEPQVTVKSTTTTSLYATGLLDYLLHEFQKKHPNWTIQFIAVGTGEALKRAEGGDACFVLVHAPNLETQYINKGVIQDGKIFAYNYFIIVGPKDDPAGVKNAKNVTDAMRRIYEAGEAGKTVFISRGDKSGTHVKEMELWKRAGLNPVGKPWYLDIGAGMGQALVVTNEKNGYTLSDTGTYLKYKKDGRIPNLEIVYSDDPGLINIYSAYLVTSCTGNERMVSQAFINFITSPEGQQLIGNYGVAEYGGPLFNPAINKLSELQAIWKQLAAGAS